MRNIITFILISGLADRVIGSVTAFMIAILTDRAFQVGRRYSLPHLETVFSSPFINWTREEDADWLIEPLKHDAKMRQYNHTVMETKEYFAVNTINDIRFQDKLLRGDLQALMGGQEISTTMLAINRGKTIRMFENEHYRERLLTMGLTPSTAFGCLMHFLFRPLPDLFLPLHKEFYTLTTAMEHKILPISIQIRAGDTFLNGNNHDHAIDIGHYRAYFDCAEQIERFALTSGNYSKVYWYLVSDSVALRRAALEEYGSDKLITPLHSMVEHSSKEASVCGNKQSPNCVVSNEGFRTAAAEWWLLSFAPYHVITRYSGYGRSAAMYSLHPDSIYTVMNGKGSASITCSPQSFTDLETLSFDWSGIR